MGPLHGIRVVEVADDLGSYAGKLLAELGADVVRVAPNRLLRAGMHVDPDVVVQRFLTRSRPSVALADDLAAALDELEQLFGDADVVLEAGPSGLLARLGIDDADVRLRHPGLVWVRVCPFDSSGPASSAPASDLTCSATGGFLGLGGWPDRAPTRAFGDQCWRMASLYAAAGTLLALIEREGSGIGQLVSVSADEAAATALENSLQFFALEGTVRRRVGPGYAEAGSGIYACADGWVYLMAGRLSTRRGWANLLDWMDEADTPGVAALRANRWADQDFRRHQEAQDEFRQVFERFTAALSKADLYHEGQTRSIAIAPVNTPADLIVNDHLAARGFFVDYRGQRVCGPPYRLSVTPWQIGHHAEV
jgi:benzylsuccinate CoA-transferase BbsE subunit